MLVREARVPDAGRVLLHADGRWWRLEVRPFPHVRVEATPPANPKRPLSFQGLLRARLPATLREVEALDNERRLSLHFTTGILEAWFFGRGRLFWREDGRIVASSDGPVAAELTPPPRPTAQGRASRLRPDDPWLHAGTLFPALAADAAAQRRAEAELQARRRRAAALQRKIEALTRDLSRARSASALREETDLLAAYAHRIPPGAREAILEDFTTGATRSLSLDPARPIRAQIAARYTRSARLEAAVADIEGRLRQAMASLDEAGAVDLHRDERSRVEMRAAPPYWCWTGPRGASLRVSRDRHSATAVLRDANPRDTWFHLRDRPSPHVILRASTPDHDAERAAVEVLLATARVDLDHDVVVQRARRCDVRPVKGEPGKVRVDRETTTLVRRAPDALRGWQRDDDSADHEA
jgi:hypothetical protein